MKDIRQELDSIITTIDGIAFKKEIKQGWEVFTSLSTGEKTATLGIDRDITLVNGMSWFGVWKTAINFQENLPTGEFQKVESVTVVPYCYESQDFTCQAWSKLPFTEEFTGSYVTIVFSDTSNPDATPPTRLHYIVSVRGF